MSNHSMRILQDEEKRLVKILNYVKSEHAVCIQHATEHAKTMAETNMYLYDIRRTIDAVGGENVQAP